MPVRPVSEVTRTSSTSCVPSATCRARAARYCRQQRRGACPLPSPAVARVCCVLSPFVSSPAQAKDGNSARTTAASRLRRTQLEAEGHGLSIAQHLCLLCTRECGQDYRVGKAGGCYASLQNLS